MDVPQAISMIFLIKQLKLFLLDSSVVFRTSKWFQAGVSQFSEIFRKDSSARSDQTWWTSLPKSKETRTHFIFLEMQIHFLIFHLAEIFNFLQIFDLKLGVSCGRKIKSKLIQPGFSFLGAALHQPKAELNAVSWTYFFSTFLSF